MLLATRKCTRNKIYIYIYMYVHTGFSFCCGCNSTTKCYTVANWKKRLVREKGKRGAARQGNIVSRAAQDNFQDTCFERFVAPKKTKKKMGNNNNDKNGKKKNFRRGACTPHYKWCADGRSTPFRGPPNLGRGVTPRSNGGH